MGLNRASLTANVEQSFDETVSLPPSIAPFDVVVTITNVSDAGLKASGEKLAEELSAAGLDVCWMIEKSAPGKVQGCRPGRNPVSGERGEEGCGRRGGVGHALHQSSEDISIATAAKQISERVQAATPVHELDERAEGGAKEPPFRPGPAITVDRATRIERNNGRNRENSANHIAAQSIQMAPAELIAGGGGQSPMCLAPASGVGGRVALRLENEGFLRWRHASVCLRGGWDCF